MECTKEIKRENRLQYLDYLRAVATIAVILIHVSAQNWDVPVLSYEWVVFNAVNGAVHWAVQMFIMLSGALFLDNDRPLSWKKLYTSKILRIVAAFLFWSTIFAVVQRTPDQSLNVTVKTILTGKYHMWFLFMLIGLYILTPVLREITKVKRVTEYFLLVGFVFLFFMPSAVGFLKYVNFPHTATLLDAVEADTSLMRMGFFSAYTFYYVFGFYLAKYELPVKVRRIGYFGGIAAYGLKMFMTIWHAAKTGQASLPFEFVICNLAMGVSLFLVAKYKLSGRHPGPKGKRILQMGSKHSFGIYLVHVLVLETMRDLGLNTLTFDPIVSVILVTLGVTVISGMISMLLHHIPVLKKWVV